MKRRMFANKGSSLSGAEKERQAKDKNEAVARTLRESIARMHSQSARLPPHVFVRHMGVDLGNWNWRRSSWANMA